MERGVGTARRRVRWIGRRRVVLVVDDDAVLLRALRARCEAIGLDVLACSSVDAALMSVHDQRPDLVVLDVHVGSGNGLEACERLGLSKRVGCTPVIIMTGDSDQETIDRTRIAGAIYVRKGAHLWDRLEPAIRKYLGFEDHESQTGGDGVRAGSAGAAD